MNTLSLLFLALGFLFVVGVPLLMYVHKRTYLDPLQKSIEWQFEKAEKIGNGWLPDAYRNFESEEERIAAIHELLSDEE
jgi:hypothetical protein